MTAGKPLDASINDKRNRLENNAQNRCGSQSTAINIINRDIII